MRLGTVVSISRNDIFSNGSAGLTTTGLVFAGAAKSHSCETPTSRSPRPRAKTISVAAGRNEMRRSSVIHQNAEFPIARGISTVPSPPLRLASTGNGNDWEFFVFQSFASIVGFNLDTEVLLKLSADVVSRLFYPFMS